jgi:hypothetical protein
LRDALLSHNHSLSSFCTEKSPASRRGSDHHRAGTRARTSPAWFIRFLPARRSRGFRARRPTLPRRHLHQAL